MGPKEKKPVARFSVQFQVANYGDVTLASRKKLAPDKVRRMTISGVVDTGASRLVLPQTVAEKMGFDTGPTTKVRYADGRRARRKTVEGVRVEMLGRSSVFDAVVEPQREDALIGALVLESLDFLVDPHKQILYPRDPRSIVNELE